MRLRKASGLPLPPPLRENCRLDRIGLIGQGRSGNRCRLAEMGSAGASTQLFRKMVLSAPISFLALASLRQAVRFTCLAAASPATGAGAAATVAVEADVVDAAAGVVDACACGG